MASGWKFNPGANCCCSGSTPCTTGVACIALYNPYTGTYWGWYGGSAGTCTSQTGSGNITRTITDGGNIGCHIGSRSVSTTGNNPVCQTTTNSAPYCFTNALVKWSSSPIDLTFTISASYISSISGTFCSANQTSVTNGVCLWVDDSNMSTAACDKVQASWPGTFISSGSCGGSYYKPGCQNASLSKCSEVRMDVSSDLASTCSDYVTGCGLCYYCSSSGLITLATDSHGFCPNAPAGSTSIGFTGNECMSNSYNFTGGGTLFDLGSPFVTCPSFTLTLVSGTCNSFATPCLAFSGGATGPKSFKATWGHANSLVMTFYTLAGCSGSTYGTVTARNKSGGSLVSYTLCSPVNEPFYEVFNGNSIGFMTN
jgi:hypothetical protein